MPSQHCRALFQKMEPLLRRDVLFVSCTKGIEDVTLLRMTEVVADVLKDRFTPRIGALSGPSFAKEVARGDPTAVTVASMDGEVTRAVQQAFNDSRFRVYTNDDVVGVELGGALKNIIAIAAGVCDGLGLGHNSVAALITRVWRKSRVWSSPAADGSIPSPDWPDSALNSWSRRRRRRRRPSQPPPPARRRVRRTWRWSCGRPSARGCARPPQRLVQDFDAPGAGPAGGADLRERPRRLAVTAELAVTGGLLDHVRQRRSREKPSLISIPRWYWRNAATRSYGCLSFTICHRSRRCRRFWGPRPWRECSASSQRTDDAERHHLERDLGPVLFGLAAQTREALDQFRHRAFLVQRPP